MIHLKQYHKFLESKFNVIFKTPTDIDLKECAKMMNDYLTTLNINFGGEEAVYGYLKGSTNCDISKVGFINNELVGCLLLGDKQITFDVRFKHFKGIEGVLFFIKDKYRGLDVDKDFLQHKPKCDYVWSLVMENLKTHNYWKRFGFKTLREGVMCVYYKFFDKETEFNNLKKNDLIFQPQTNHYNCGTTVASMIIKYVNNIDINNSKLFDKYCEVKYGTTTYNMVDILKDYNIKYTHIKNTNINEYLENGYMIVCLISMKGNNIPHWIILNEYFEEEYVVFDPAHGVYNIDIVELSDILNIKDWNGISKDIIMQYAGQYQLLAIEK